jgi:hypothetical protein
MNRHCNLSRERDRRTVFETATYNVASNSAFNCGYRMMINRKIGM